MQVKSPHKKLKIWHLCVTATRTNWVRIINLPLSLNLLSICRKYADDHLLNEIQDPRSDDDIDLSGE